MADTGSELRSPLSSHLTPQHNICCVGQDDGQDDGDDDDDECLPRIDEGVRCTPVLPVDDLTANQMSEFCHRPMRSRDRILTSGFARFI